MRVCICGGGNAVHVMASDMGARDDLWVGIYAPFQDEAERMNSGLAGTNQLPYQCRILDYGSCVELIGHKRQIKVATEPHDKATEVARLLTDLIGVTEVGPLPHFLSVTLTPGNQVIHPTIMYGLFHDYCEPMATPPLFYQNTDDFTADVMTQTSNEVLAIASAVSASSNMSIPVPALDEMMREMYADELEDPSTMKSIFRSNLGYKNLYAPMVETADGRFAPNFGYRYLTEDIPRGQCVLKGVALLAGVETPTINRLIRWAGEAMDKPYLLENGDFNPALVKETAAPQAFGLDSMESIM